MQILTMGESAATPWSFSPVWFVVVAVLAPAIVWVTLAWRRAFAEDPNRLRRSGVKEMRRLLAQLRRSRSTPQSRHLHAWMRATARTWGVRASAPTSVEVVKACHAVTSDAPTVTRWRDLWHVTERGLFSAEAKAPQDWLERATTAAAGVQMPKRERKYPNRRTHWLPAVGMVCLVAGAMSANPSRADVPMSGNDYSAPTAPLTPPSEASAPASSADTLNTTANETAEPAPMDHAAMVEAQKAARDALAVNWNDWAAHHNMAALGIEAENWNLAIAYATASFLQHPSSTITRETLRTALDQTQTADDHLRRMVSGSWYERIPSLLSAAGWQRLALFAGLLVAAALTVLVASLYGSDHLSLHGSDRLTHKRYVVWAGRATAIVGVIALTLSTIGWQGYGTMSRPEAAILLQNVNVSPTPTDLVPLNETSPAAAGAIVLTQRTFLGWQQISIEGRASGWVRRNTLMPIYAKKT